MERTQVSLTSNQLPELRRVARKRGIRAADLIARWERALASIGGFKSGRSDISEQHDKYLFDD